jgi:hypothetical protein
MRSDLVYRANSKVPNRFQLCRLASSSARNMNRSSVGMHLIINEALAAISGHSAPVVAPASDPIETQAAEISPALLLDSAV